MTFFDSYSSVACRPVTQNPKCTFVDFVFIPDGLFRNRLVSLTPKPFHTVFPVAGKDRC